MEKSIVLKIGGSLLYTGNLKLNTLFVSKLLAWFKEARNDYKRIIMVVGGGKLSRHLGDEAEEFISNGPDDLHGMSMQATMLNASMIKEILDSKHCQIYAPRTLGEAFEFLLDDKIKFIVSGGLKEGWSTDMDAAVFADAAGIDRIHKLSNVDSVYDADPFKSKKAKPLKELSWKEYFELFGANINSKHAPNKSVPIDFIASGFCYRKGLSYYLSGGKSITKNSDLGSILESGTYVH